jgi:hypothetical protein
VEILRVMLELPELVKYAGVVDPHVLAEESTIEQPVILQLAPFVMVMKSEMEGVVAGDLVPLPSFFQNVSAL